MLFSLNFESCFKLLMSLLIHKCFILEPKASVFSSDKFIASCISSFYGFVSSNMRLNNVKMLTTLDSHVNGNQLTVSVEYQCSFFHFTCFFKTEIGKIG